MFDSWDCETSSLVERRKSVSAGVLEQSIGDDEIAACSVFITQWHIAGRHVLITASSASITRRLFSFLLFHATDRYDLFQFLLPRFNSIYTTVAVSNHVLYTNFSHRPNRPSFPWPWPHPFCYTLGVHHHHHHHHLYSSYDWIAAQQNTIEQRRIKPLDIIHTKH